MHIGFQKTKIKGTGNIKDSQVPAFFHGRTQAFLWKSKSPFLFLQPVKIQNKNKNATYYPSEKNI